MLTQLVTIILFQIAPLPVVLSYNSTKVDRLYALFMIGFLGSLSALRANTVGNDTAFFLYLYDSIANNHNILSYLDRFEIGYLVLNRIATYICHNSQFILVLTSFMIYSGYFRFIIKYSKSPWLSIFFFVTLGFWGDSMNTIREQIATVILLFSYDFIRDRKFIPFIFLTILASLFHRTAIIFLVAYPFINVRTSTKNIVLFISAGLFIAAFFKRLFSKLVFFFPIFSYYANSKYLNGQIRLASILTMLIYLLILILSMSAKGSLVGDRYRDFKNMQSMLLICIALLTASFGFSLLDRVASYFGSFSLVLLPNAIVSYDEKKETRLAVTYLICLLCFCYELVREIMRPGWIGIFPYSFFWQTYS